MGWSIFGIVLGCIALLAVFVLLTPVHVIVKSNQEELLALSYRILCFRFGGKKKPESVGGKSLEQVLGVFQVKSGKEEGEEAKGKPISHTIDRLSKILTSLLKRVKTLLKRCRITRLHLHIVCAGEDAAAAAVEYGRSRCCHIRVDTHADNKPMQHLAEKYGFSRRGIIYVEDGTPRIAYDLL